MILAQVALKRHACLFEVALHRLCNQLFTDIFKSQLDGVVAVRLDGLFLRYHAWARFDDRHRNNGAVFQKELRHAHLSAQYRLHPSSLPRA